MRILKKLKSEQVSIEILDTYRTTYYSVCMGGYVCMYVILSVREKNVIEGDIQLELFPIFPNCEILNYMILLSV